MELQKYKDLIDAFLKWSDEHPGDENLYRDQLTYLNLSSLKRDAFIKFFYEFYADGGNIQSGGHRTKNQFREILTKNYMTFREYLLQPFIRDFNVKEWLLKRRDFNYWGEGISTIYLNRINPQEYPVINNKTVNGLKLLGFNIRPNQPFKYEDIKTAQSLLIKEFPELRNYFRTDLLNQFVVSEPEGKQLIGEINPTGLGELRQRTDDPIWSIIDAYKEQLNERGFADELYKWKAVKHFQEVWNPEAPNFGEMFASAIDLQTNLISYFSFSAINIICENDPSGLKEIILQLFDEDKPVVERIIEYQAGVSQIMKKIDKDKRDFQDERAISLYLFLRYPEKYIHYKDSYYTELLKLFGKQKVKPGDKYLHFQQIANEFKEKYVVQDQELLTQVQMNLPEDVYQDPAKTLLTQDILYFLDVNKEPSQPANYWVFQGNPQKFDIVGALRDESLRTWSVTAHKDKIKKGDKIIL